MGDTEGKTLYLLRHAKAQKAAAGEDDEARPLMERGRDAAARVAEWFSGRKDPPDTILCSPSVRTRETLEVVEPSLGAAKVIYDERLYGAAPEAILKLLAKLPNSAQAAMVVGHNPGLEELALKLAGHDSRRMASRMAEKFPTCALAVFSAPVRAWSDFADNCRLDEFIRPVDLD